MNGREGKRERGREGGRERGREGERGRGGVKGAIANTSIAQYPLVY